MRFNYHETTEIHQKLSLLNQQKSTQNLSKNHHIKSQINDKNNYRDTKGIADLSN